MSIPKIDLSDFIEKWKSAKRGKEVRQASTDAFEQIQRIVNEALQKCYDEATGNPESILAHTGNTKNPHETKAANLPVTDTYGAAGTAGNTVFMQALADALADKIVNQVLTKGELINNALATEAGVAALDAAMGKTLQDQITQQNSNLTKKMDKPSYGGVMEIGKYIDFHNTGSEADYDGRLYISENGTFYTDKGAIALLSDIKSLHSVTLSVTTSANSVATFSIGNIGASSIGNIVNVAINDSNDYIICRLWIDGSNINAFIRKYDGSVASSVTLKFRLIYLE